MSRTGCLNPVPPVGYRFNFGDGRPIAQPDPAMLRYLLAPTAIAKPLAFPTLRDLARKIQRERRSQALQLANVQVSRFGEGGHRQVVAVHTLDDRGDRDRFLGYAWLDGGDRETLEHAIALAGDQGSAALRGARAA